MSIFPGARASGGDLGLLLPVFAALPREWADVERYAAWEGEARRLMAARDEDDWPTVALAIWTQDKDFEVASLPILTTGQLLDSNAGRGP